MIAGQLRDSQSCRDLLLTTQQGARSPFCRANRHAISTRINIYRYSSLYRTTGIDELGWSVLDCRTRLFL